MQQAVCVRRNKREEKKPEIVGNCSINNGTYQQQKRKESVKLSIIYNNYIARLVHKRHIRNEIENKYAQRTCLIVKQLEKFSFNHSIGRTHSWRL